DFGQTVAEIGNVPKQALPPEQMTFDVENNGYKLRVIFQNINITKGDSLEAGVDYELMIMFGVPTAIQ
ncbi:MAG TPA: DUF4153 domain-containing protein, partial [Syntrophomonas sp.]|nr:DUF4153 domain-containing protein [Syntrophomonas sp.]